MKKEETNKRHYDTLQREFAKAGFALCLIILVFFVILFFASPPVSAADVLPALATFWGLLLIFGLAWITAGQISIMFLDDVFFIRKALTKKTKPYSELKAICIVPERFYAKYFGYRRNYTLKIKKENNKLKVSKINYYRVCFLSEPFVNEKLHKKISGVLYSDTSVSDHFYKKHLVTVRYTPELLEDLFSHGEVTIYLNSKVLNDISGDIQKLVEDDRINKGRCMGDVVILSKK